MKQIITLIILAMMALSSWAQISENEVLAEMAISVTQSENREYSYTNKKAGFWYGRTHQDEPVDWYAGWNVAKRRLLSDYTILFGGQPLKRSEASKVIVNPACIMRGWDRKVTEMLSMVDDVNALCIFVFTTNGNPVSLELNKTLLNDTTLSNCYVPKESPDHLIKVETQQLDENITVFTLVYGTNEAECNAILAHCKDPSALGEERAQRIAKLVTEGNPVKTNLPNLDKALNWLTVTMDQLVTEQQGKGIYAGLPWFNEYWGRDMFIAMPGATLVSGQFDYTKEILKDFAKFQDTDTSSITCGRIPNRANLEGILYNTADGTPRYVMEAEELLQYSGDTSFLKDIYPSVVLSIDQSIKKCTDAKGYLLHEDADTWMDVKRNGIPGSPRGNRANDIQWLWWKQLTAGSHLARLMGDTEHEKVWSAFADKVAHNFEADFCNVDSVLIYDHLNIDGTPDLQYRPNQLFCFDLVKNDDFKQKVTRRVWENLVYPWGVASLAQWDKQFHPQHENWHYYHKDDAYHNGTIWLWNNGIAMQRMIEYGQQETAWLLFQNMNRQALKEGAVGSLSENANAHPREGQTWVDRSGTFLQAWSNSEQLRVWYQYFLGIRPDLMNNVIVIEPKLPKAVTDVETTVKIGKGTLYYSYQNGKVNVKLEGVTGANGKAPRIDMRIETDAQRAQAAANPNFIGVDFCMPHPLSHYPCFDHYYDPPLTY